MKKFRGPIELKEFLDVKAIDVGLFRNEIIDKAISDFLQMDENIQKNKIEIDLKRIEIEYHCPKELMEKIEKLRHRKSISSEEIIRRAIYKYFDIKNEDDLKRKIDELGRIIENNKKTKGDIENEDDLKSKGEELGRTIENNEKTIGEVLNEVVRDLQDEKNKTKE